MVERKAGDLGQRRGPRATRTGEGAKRTCLKLSVWSKCFEEADDQRLSIDPRPRRIMRCVCNSRGGVCSIHRAPIAWLRISVAQAGNLRAAWMCKRHSHWQLSLNGRHLVGRQSPRRLEYSTADATTHGQRIRKENSGDRRQRGVDVYLQKPLASIIARSVACSVGACGRLAELRGTGRGSADAVTRTLFAASAQGNLKSSSTFRTGAYDSWRNAVGYEAFRGAYQRYGDDVGDGRSV